MQAGLVEPKSLSSGVPPALPISDREYVQACLNVANNRNDFSDGLVGKLEPAPDAKLINCYLIVMHFEKVNWTSIIHEDFARLHRSEAKELRGMLRRALNDVQASTAVARRRRRSRIDVMLDGVAVETELHLLRDGRVEHRHRYAPKDNEAAVALLWVFLLDPDRPFETELRLCSLQECPKYFLAEKNPAGGPRRKYCSPEHTYAADKIMAVRRQARSQKGE